MVNGSTHFVNGSNVYEGRVELCLNNQWGTVIVCDDSLDSYDAQVVCRQLGYSANGAVAFTYAYFGNGFWFEEVNCSGSEPNVLYCSANFTDQCVQQEAVGVQCINSFSSLIPSPTETPNGKSNILLINIILILLIIIVCTTNGSIRLVNGNTFYEGRVEVCINNQWGTVCDDAWDSVDARVVCKQLGYPSSGAIAFSNAYFGSGYGPIWLDDVNCNGSESSLVNCTNYGIGIHNCGHYEDAGVRCIDSSSFSSVTPSPTPTPFGKSVSAVWVSKCLFSVCNSGSIRLVNGSNIYEGRVEVCLNNQWGTVCDDEWDSADAGIVCTQLGYPSSGAVAIANAYFGSGYGPIWLNEVNCSGSEFNLFNCNLNFTHDCTHSEDAGVQCIIESSTPVVTPTPTNTGNY